MLLDLHCKLIQCYCSSSKSGLIKNLNYTNKALFGAVIKEKKKLSPSPIPTIDTANDSSYSKENQLNAEIYWLMKDKATQPMTAATPIKQSNTSSPTSSTEPTNNENAAAVTAAPIPRPNLQTKLKISTSVSSTLRKFTQALLPTPVNVRSSSSVIGTPPEHIHIPFTDKEFKKILKFPMLSDGSKLLADKPPIELSNMPSVSKILQATMPDASRKALMKWKLLKIAELGEDGFVELQKSKLRCARRQCFCSINRPLLKMHILSVHLTTGSNFHSSLHQYFETRQKVDYPSPLKELWQSVGKTVATIDGKPALVEQPLCHPYLKYKGIADCAATIE